MSFLKILPPVDIRGPKPMPVIGPNGNVFRFFADPVGWVRRAHRTYGPIVALNDGSPSLVCAFGPEHNRQVLTNPGIFQNNTEMFFPIPETSAASRMNRSLVMMNGDTHRRERRRMMPAFTRAAVDGYREDVIAVAESSLRALTPGTTVDISDATTALTLRVAMKCFFGLTLQDGADELAKLAVAFLDGLTSVATMLAPVDVPGLPYARFLRTAERFEAGLLALIARRRREPLARDVLSILIHAHDEDGSSFADAELISQAALLFIAGHETTSHTLAWALFLLSQHPRVRTDLLDELTGKLHGDAPTSAALAELPLLDHVVKESMRLLPATPVAFVRFTSSEAQLGPHVLPKGSGVMVSPLITHQLPELYADPLCFRPRRWETLDPSPYEYLPFGAGPRMCLGASFATMAVRVLLAMILQRVSLDVVPGARISRKFRGITMGPKHGIPMRVGPWGAAPPGRADVRGDVHELVDLPR